MATEPYVPPTKLFPDGSYINYWFSDRLGYVVGQLFTKGGRHEGANFQYHGPDPAPWDRSRHIMAKCIHCPDEPEFAVATLPMTLVDTAKILDDASCPKCDADSASLRVAFE
jgi:hypothetical protein